MNPAYFIIWFYFNNNFRFSIKWYSRAHRLYSINMWSTPAVRKKYNKMAVLHFFLVNSPLIYILFSMLLSLYLVSLGAILFSFHVLYLWCNTGISIFSISWCNTFISIFSISWCNTVYLYLVSLGAILLSLYYIFLWKNPHTTHYLQHKVIFHSYFH